MATVCACASKYIFRPNGYIHPLRLPNTRAFAIVISVIHNVVYLCMYLNTTISHSFVELIEY